MVIVFRDKMSKVYKVLGVFLTVLMLVLVILGINFYISKSVQPLEATVSRKNSCTKTLACSYVLYIKDLNKTCLYKTYGIEEKQINSVVRINRYFTDGYCQDAYDEDLKGQTVGTILITIAGCILLCMVCFCVIKKRKPVEEEIEGARIHVA